MNVVDRLSEKTNQAIECAASNKYVLSVLVVLSFASLPWLASTVIEDWQGVAPHFEGHSWILGLFALLCGAYLAFRGWVLGRDQSRWSVPKRIAVAIAGMGLPWAIAIAIATLLYGPHEVWTALEDLVP